MGCAKYDMVQLNSCFCHERYATIIDSWALFLEVKDFLEGGLDNGVFEDTTKVKPYNWGKNEKGEQILHYTQRLFKCKICGCLWALRYPDFPGHGFVGKYPDGNFDEERWKQDFDDEWWKKRHF